jgi:hypothetical protein
VDGAGMLTLLVLLPLLLSHRLTFSRPQEV